MNLHNSGKVRSTKPYHPWELVWYCGFTSEKQARDFELYLKSGSGKGFAYKRFVHEVLMKDFQNGRVPKVLRTLKKVRIR